MPSYFMLECFGPEEVERAGVAKIHVPPDVSWRLGRPIFAPLPKPIRVELDPDDGVMVPLFDEGVLLLSDMLLAALRAAGVDNLDAYDAELFNPHTKAVFKDYKAVNIIGLVSAADLGLSEHQAHGTPLIDVDFDSLHVDDAKAHGLLMFRLAECVTGIVVHEQVKRHVESVGIRDLSWVDPHDWIG